MQRDCMDIGRVYSVLGMPSNVIRLPGQFNGLTMSHVVRKLGALASSGALPKTIAFDFGTLRFIRPAGVTFLNNLVEWLHVKRVSVEFSGLSPFSAAISYLDDSLFFERHLGDKLNEHSRPRNTTLPLKVVSQDESHMWLRTNFTPSR